MRVFLFLLGMGLPKTQFALSTAQNPRGPCAKDAHPISRNYVSLGAPDVKAQQGQKANVVFILGDNIAKSTWEGRRSL
jgi:hypothetical protein